MLLKEAFNSGMSGSINSALNLPLFYLWFIIVYSYYTLDVRSCLKLQSIKY
jgi:hypothetical protein